MESRFKMTRKDHEILQYACQKYSCSICSSILIQCVTLSCGHHYCSYCLDMLGSETAPECPQCSASISRAQPNHSIDREIDNLMRSCSEPIQKSYSSAVSRRFQKSLERKKTRYDNEGQGLSSRCEYTSVPKRFNERHGRRDQIQMDDRTIANDLKSGRQQNFQRYIARNSNFEMGSEELHTEIDMDTVNLLFGIYEHVLSPDNEPNKTMASGDFIREEDAQEMEFPVLESMNNFTSRSEAELETLIKETDDIIRLDGHIQKWTSKMKDALHVTDETVGIGIADEYFDKNMHVVNDELWKASSELLLKLQGIQKQRKNDKKPGFDFNNRLPPRQRSPKLAVDGVSDDSDAEEYEQALETLQEALNESTDQYKNEIEEQSNQKLGMVEDSKQQHNIMNHKQNFDGNRSARRRKSLLDCVEESGYNYINENIDFITKMRKYKEALMKIQKREAVTAQEIKELVPTSRSEDSDGAVKCGDSNATMPKRLSQISQGSRRSRSYSARLPSSARMDPGPLTSRYDVATSQQLIHKHIAVVPTKPYLKQRTRATNSLFTAR